MGASPCPICQDRRLRKRVEDLALEGGDVGAISALLRDTDIDVSPIRIRKHITNHCQIDLEKVHPSLVIKTQPPLKERVEKAEINLQRKQDVEAFIDQIAGIDVDKILTECGTSPQDPTNHTELHRNLSLWAYQIHKRMFAITYDDQQKVLQGMKNSVQPGYIKALESTQGMVERLTGVTQAASLDTALQTVMNAGFVVTGTDGNSLDPADSG